LTAAQHTPPIVGSEPTPALAQRQILWQSEQDTERFARQLAALPQLRNAYVTLHGDLGAGKTTLAQGLGEGLAVSGPVISPTFVLARVHPATGTGPALVHADAYRLGGFAELEDLDLEESLDDSVTYIEWGAGVAERLAPEHLGVEIIRGLEVDDETRWVVLTPSGHRWYRQELADAVARLEGSA